MVNMKCENCEEKLRIGDVYIHDPSEDVRYCYGCYEENTITTYSVGGEFIGTDDDGVTEYHRCALEGKDEY